MLNDFEYRMSELKTSDADMMVEGRAIVYEQPTLLRDNKGKQFREIITRGALDGCDMKDVPLRYNHNIKGDYPILARTRNKSLELIPDEQGLMIRASLLDNNIYNAVKSGLLDGMSFGMFPKKENVSWRFDTPDGIPERRVNKIDRLADVSVVDTPAYSETSIYARSFELLDNELKALDSEKSELELLKLKNQIKTKVR